jgi:glycyl-tRNA synthetase beta chain
LEDLKDVIYQTDLGTSHAKVERFARLAAYLCERFLPDARDDVRTVAELCKCDLVTEMVSEFPSLQGKIGEVYARMDGYPEEISSAIREHYLPERAGSELPVSDVAAIVGCADRMDTISGCFAVGLEPTGSADPFALRRHALAIIRIIEDRGWDLSLKNFFERSLSILREEINFEPSQVFSRMWEFFRERYRHMMLRSGYDLELIEAAISVEFDRINQMQARIDGLKRFTSESEEFHSLALTFKRITNILKKQEASFDVDTALFKNRSESSLWQVYQELKGDVLKQLEGGRYYEALNVLVRLRKPVDEFFDSVEIMVKDNENLKHNRLALLQYLTKLFLRVADLSKFSI